jgi:hypothetical protein
VKAPYVLISAAVFLICGIVPALSYINDDILFTDKIAYGVGRTIGILAISCLGLLYRKHRIAGFAVAASIFTALSLFASYNLSHAVAVSEERVAVSN